MADLKPIGSEKLQGEDKIKRILEIARYKENVPSNVNESSRTEFAKTLADGQTYEIVKEKLGYVIKQHVNESLDYVEPMKNRKYYKSYSQALKRLNLMAGEINRLTENEEEVSMFNLGEQKKFTLKLPKQEVPAPAPEPTPEMDAELPDEGDMGLDADNTDVAGEEDINVDVDVEEPTQSDEEEVDFKLIQKLTGKLGQKIRTMNESVGMTSEDVKYVINSILSALDLSKLDETDKEDIVARFEEDSDYGMEGDELDLDVSGDAEMEMDVDMEGEATEAMGASSAGQFSAPLSFESEEMSEEDKMSSQVSKIMDSVFGESKVDRVLSKYFVISESEKKEKKSPLTKRLERISKLSESEEQKLAAEFIVNENKNLKFLGKTNKNNLVFEAENVQVKVSPKGEIL
jgi:cell division protein ZapA (FtsZ GTPase activity inhibitor)